ncbi:hypothetical protein BGZ47_009863 [Haplosporangium gracile]|nr:hypothetical protein BGZ47_009863 [Haplosporangium gracile]
MESDNLSRAPSEIDPDTQRVVASLDTSDMDTENSSITTTPSGLRLVDNGDFLFEPQTVGPNNDDKARNADSDLFTSVVAQQQQQVQRRQAQQQQQQEEQQQQPEEEFYQQQLINSNTTTQSDSSNNSHHHHYGPSSNPLRQKMIILHPALVAEQLPSTKAPTVYALASSVPFPTVNQLSINLLNQPTTSEKVAVPFQTILHTPAVNVVSEPGKMPSGISIDELSPIVSTTPSDTMDIDPIQQPPSQVPHALSTVDAGEQQSNEDDVHPYFAASNLLPRPRAHLPNGSSTPSGGTTSLLPGSAVNGWSKMDVGLISPPLSTTFFTSSSNSTQMPVHHAVHDQQLDPNLVQRTAEAQQIQSDVAARAAGESVSIGSRTTVFGFAPLVNSADQQANMKSSEERVLSDGHCQTIPLDTPSRQSGDAGQVTPAVDPTRAPHVRAGISPSLNLDQVETRPADQQKEASVESLVNSKDWSTTGLGPRSSWPVELSFLMPMLLRSASPLAIYWGEQCLLIYNDKMTVY